MVSMLFVILFDSSITNARVKYYILTGILCVSTISLKDKKSLNAMINTNNHNILRRIFTIACNIMNNNDYKIRYDSVLLLNNKNTDKIR